MLFGVFCFLFGVAYVVLVRRAYCSYFSFFRADHVVARKQAAQRLGEREQKREKIICCLMKRRCMYKRVIHIVVKCRAADVKSCMCACITGWFSVHSFNMFISSFFPFPVVALLATTAVVVVVWPSCLFIYFVICIHAFADVDWNQIKNFYFL